MKSKVMFSLLLVGSIFLFSNVTAKAEECYLVNNNDICISEEHYNNLANLGFNDFEIQNMPLDLYDENKDLEGQVVSSVTNYYIDTYYYENGQVVNTESKEVTEEEYESFVPSNVMNSVFGSALGNRSYDGYSETTGKKLTTQIIWTGSTFRYKNYLLWKSIPSTRSYDITAIGLENDRVYENGGRYFLQYYCTTPASCTSNSNPIYNSQSTGLGASFKLPEGTIVSLSSTFYYNVSKKSGVGTVTSLYAYGDYAHATSNVTSTQSTYYGVGTGIGLYSSVVSYYDSMSSAVANWTGSW